MSKTYKALFVPEELHHIIKVQATKKKVSMIELLENVMRDFDKVYYGVIIKGNGKINRRTYK